MQSVAYGAQRPGGPVDIGRIAAALGPFPNVAYEAAHVYPMSAPDFRLHPGTPRERPAPGPLKLYVHIPFCNYACRFCFYAKRVGSRRDQMERYVRGLQRELEWVENTTPLTQLYMGGGTPTALDADLLDELLATIFATMPPAPGASRSVESSPESLSAEHVRVLQTRGVERVSMGIQSLDEHVLEAINRRHSARQAIEACELLVASGFFVNVDLMYGLPGQSEASFRSDLEACAARRPDSFTIYDLRLNEHAPLGSGVSAADRLDLARLMQWRATVLAATHALGYVQTRWHTFVRHDHPPSAYDRAPCVDGFAAGRQLGIGVSAVSHLGETIYRNHGGFDGYLTRVERDKSPVEETFPLTEEDHKTLFVIRTLGDGARLHRAEYAEAFGNAIEEDFGAAIDCLGAADLIHEEAGQLFLSETGRLVYDLVTVAFYPPRAQRWLRERQHLFGSN
ncbi:MAG TPA: coproporphyrinogen-III oxidase family protein [Candidatus Acidoferrales bacterium]|nr:coproporphyrinogen-III oxidase family protein [Candidatus Acidoferrales bacterium]